MFNNIPSYIKNTSHHPKRSKINLKCFFDYTLFPQNWRNIIPDDTCGGWFNFSFICHVLFRCINLSAVFILTLLIHIVITSCSVVLLLHFVQLLSLLYSWSIMGVFVFAYSYAILHISLTISTSYLAVFKPCKDLLNVNK